MTDCTRGGSGLLEEVNVGLKTDAMVFFTYSVMDRD
jgi:hypothetical protein